MKSVGKYTGRMQSFNQRGLIYPASFFPGYFYTKRRYAEMPTMEVPSTATRASPAEHGSSTDYNILFLSEMQPRHIQPDVSAELRRLIRKAPVVVINLETPVSTIYREPIRAPMFPSFTMTIREFKDMLDAFGILPSKCIVNLANNHSHDLGKHSLRNTTKHLLDLGCRIIGTREHPSVIVNGTRILGCTSRINPLSYEYADTLVQPDDIPLHDGVPTIVYVHWGWEYYDEPDDQTLALAEYWCRPQTNVVAIIGHGPHLLQRMRTINGRPVFYSFGDTVSQTPYTVGNPRSLSGLVQVAVKNGALRGYAVTPILECSRIADTADSLRRFRAYYM